MNRFARLLPAALVLLPLATGAAVDPRRFPYRKELRPEASAEGAVAVFVLDDDLYAATDDDFANLRIVDDAGAEVAFCVRRQSGAVTQIVERATAAAVHRFEPGANNEAVLVVDAGERPPAPSALALRTAGRNFEKRASVSASDSADGPWEPRVSDAAIYDYSRFIDVRRLRIDLPPADARRYLRIEITRFVERAPEAEIEVTTTADDRRPIGRAERRVLREEALRIDGVDLLVPSVAIRADAPILRPCELPPPRPDPRAPDGASAWTIDTARRPLVSLCLETPARNFSRRIELDGWRAGPPFSWTRLAETTLHNLHIGGVREHRLSIELPGAPRHERCRLTVHNLDSPPIELTGVAATGHVYETMFFPRPGRTYAALYGGAGHAAPRYDVAAVLRGIPAPAAVRCTVGPQTPNPMFKAGLGGGPGRARLLFLAAIAAAVVALAWAIVHGAKKVGTLPP